MNKFLKFAALAAAPVAMVAAMPNIALAQSLTGIAVADHDEAIQKSNAWVVAMNQLQTSQKTLLDQIDARGKILSGETQQMAIAFQTAQKAPNPNPTLLQQQYQALVKKQQDAEAEIQRMGAPINRARAYALEQMEMKWDGALKSAMTKKGIALVLVPGATVSYRPSVDMTNDVIAELNAAVPSVSITPPANWQPGGQGGAAAPAAPVTPQPAKPAPQGR
jgi:Skp family chaperone for outer membrane proteins